MVVRNCFYDSSYAIPVPRQLFTVHCQFQQRKGTASPWFDLNLNFGASYIGLGLVLTPPRQQRQSLSLPCSWALCFLSLSFSPSSSSHPSLSPPFLSLSPSTPTFIQWITSLVATFRGLLIPAGQIIQIGLLRSCPNLMSVMLLYPLHILSLLMLFLRSVYSFASSALFSLFALSLSLSNALLFHYRYIGFSHMNIYAWY